MKLYARIDGKLAVWQTDETDPDVARNEVLHHINDTYAPETVRRANPVLAVIESSK